VPSNDDSKILPPMMNDRARPQANRTILGVLLALLAVAVLLGIGRLIFDRGDSATTNLSTQSALPTALTIVEPTAPPADATAQPLAIAPTAAPAAAATPVPAGFEACATDALPLTITTYIVDTNTTPLNQRAEPAVTAEQTGTFAPGQDDLVFTGDCVVNVNDGYTWWEIFNGTDDVWVASSFVTAN